MLARKAVSSSKVSTLRPLAPRRKVAARAIDDTNFAINLISSLSCGGVVAAVTTLTSENKDKEIERIQTVEGALPIAAAIGVDAIAHSIPGLNLLFGLASEPAGAAAGVAYMMSILLSSPSVNPVTLAPKGTLMDAEKANDTRAFLRYPFTKVVNTALKVVDTENDGSSGAGWKVGPDGIPKLPINSVLIVIGVGSVILEAASHAPVLGLFMPRVLCVAGWLAATGYFLDKRE